MQIIQIVPRIPPVFDGVGDYAFTLAQNLAKDHGVQTNFVVCDPAYDRLSKGEVAGHFPVAVLARRDSDALINVIRTRLPASPLLLHYVQYGYALKGCPLWLRSALRTLCAGDTSRVLVTMFHELYARGRFPRSSFWLSPLQRSIARSVARLSRACVTSRDIYAEELTRWIATDAIRPSSLPIPSNVGEAGCLGPFEQRQPWIIVFGLANTRAAAYGAFASDLERTCVGLGIEQIIDIGPDPGVAPEKVGGTPVIARGPLPRSAIGDLLTKGRAGFLVYDLNYLARSGVFAAYCAYGLAPICAHMHRCTREDAPLRPRDGIGIGEQFHDNELCGGALTPDAAVGVAFRAYAWYRTHAQAAHAAHFSELLRRLSKKSRVQN